MAKGIKTGGRKKGAVNKLTSSFKELVQQTFEQLETDGRGMYSWAQTNKTEFYKIASKLIPAEMAIKADIIKHPVTYILPNGKEVEM